MTKFQDGKNKYIIFWETKEDVLPTQLNKQAVIFATMLKMLECDTSVEVVGRCEGVVRNDKHWYNGFLLFKGTHKNLDILCNKYKQYIRITGKHRYKNIQEMRDCISTW